LFHHIVFARHHHGEIEIELSDLDAVGGERVVGFIVEVRRLLVRLGGYGGDVGGGSGVGAPTFDTCGLLSQLRGAQCADVAARTAANNDNVE
jgi:hypothetical protein